MMPHPSFTVRNRAGLLITALVGVGHVPSAFAPTGDDGESEGPPFGVLVLDSILGVVVLVACGAAWRSGSRAIVRIAAGAAILAALTAVPAFFVDVSAGIKILVAVTVIVAFVGVVLMLSPERRNAAVLD